MISEPTTEQYITDLTNSCAFLDTFVSESGDVSRVKELMDGIKYQITLVPDEDVTVFQASVDAAQAYLDAE